MAKELGGGRREQLFQQSERIRAHAPRSPVIVDCAVRRAHYQYVFAIDYLWCDACDVLPAAFAENELLAPAGLPSSLAIKPAMDHRGALPPPPPARRNPASDVPNKMSSSRASRGTESVDSNKSPIEVSGIVQHLPTHSRWNPYCPLVEVWSTTRAIATSTRIPRRRSSARTTTSGRFFLPFVSVSLLLIYFALAQRICAPFQARKVVAEILQPKQISRTPKTCGGGRIQRALTASCGETPRPCATFSCRVGYDNIARDVIRFCLALRTPRSSLCPIRSASRQIS